MSLQAAILVDPFPVLSSPKSNVLRLEGRGERGRGAEEKLNVECGMRNVKIHPGNSEQ